MPADLNAEKPARVLLINPRLSGEARYGKFKDVGSYLPPYGLLSIAGVLEQHGHVVMISDADSRRGLSLEQLKDVVIGFRPDIIGLTAYSIGKDQLLETARHIKSFSPAVIVAGGPHVMVFPEDLAEYDCFDLLVYGEGEYVMLDILEHYRGRRKLAEIEGIVYRENGNTIRTPQRAFIRDLDSLPHPAFHLLRDMGDYRPMQLLYKKLPVLPVITGRGCPYSCIFCNSLWGKKVRLNSPGYIMSLVRNVVEAFGVREIMFYEDTFCIEKERIHELCDLIIGSGMKISWSCSANIRTVDQPLLKKMKDAGCWLVSLGIESGNDDVLRFVKKPVTTEEARRVCMWADEAGLRIRGFFMLGHPIDTKTTIRQTIEFMKSLPLFTVNFTILQLLPGSEFRNIAHAFGEVDYDLGLGTGHPRDDLSFVPRGLTAEYLKYMQRRGYREFFLRPSQLWRLLKAVDSFEDVRKYGELASAFVKLYAVK